MSAPLTLEYSITLDDIVAFIEHFQRTSPFIRRRARIGVVVGAVSVFLLICVFTAMMFKRAHLLTAALGVAIFLAINSRLSRWMRRGTIRGIYKDGAHKGTLGKHRLTLTPDGLTEETEAGTSTRKWGTVEKVARTERYVFVYVSSASAHVVPMTAFASPADCDAFVKAVEGFIQSARAAAPTVTA